MSRNPLKVDHYHSTIASIYQAAEEYLELLAASPAISPLAPALTMPPIDTLLIHLLGLYQSERPCVVDLAAQATMGVSTLLCRTDPAVRRVLVPLENATHPWQAILDGYLLSSSLPVVECVTVAEVRDALERVAGTHTTLLVIAPSEDATKQGSSESFLTWLDVAPQAVIVLLGVGKTGESVALASLIGRCTGPAHRLALVRELAPALAESGIALIGRRDNEALASSLERIGQLFANQFRFLDLIKRVCDSALEQSVFNEPLHASQRAGYLEPQSANTMYDLRRALAERERELLELRQSLSFRILQGVRRLGRLSRLPRSVLRVLVGGRNAQAEEQSTSAPLRRAS